MQRLKDLDLTGRRAFVTGSTRGLGLEVARSLRTVGADVAVVGRDEATVAAVAEQLRRAPSRGGDAPEVVEVCGDLGSTEGLRSVIDQALGTGPWDILVNNAGVAPVQPFLAVDPGTWQRTLAVNLTAAMFLSQALAHSMADRGWGRIVNVASQAGRRAVLNHTGYCASKAGLMMLTKSQSVELGPLGIRANVICPTIFLSDMGHELWGDASVLAGKIDQVPAKRLGDMTELADLVLFLCSEAADFVNGSDISIDGGLLAGAPLPGGVDESEIAEQYGLG